MNILDIKNPKFLKKMKKKDLENLSLEIRKFIIENVSKTGGHVSSNLGIVDLTIAIHKVFDSPKDKIIFDVGHQSYTHKILTGRAKDFTKLRQLHGLSGYQKRKESFYDSYEAGHSSTSLSAAVGYVMARKQLHKKYNVVAIIGDGSIGNGLAYEALNHIGTLEEPLIVILNDNEMSISKNVGALHNTLDKIRSTYNYESAKNSTKNFLKKIPLIGNKLSTSVSLIKESIKKLYMKEGYLFEEFGLDYYGPINGHDYDEMITYLELAKKAKRPVLLHVITEKGKGYKYAEEDQEGKWHGVGPFDIETGVSTSPKTDKISWSEVISNKLIELAKVDKKIVAITPAMTNGSKLLKFKEKFPNRFIDVGIAEEHSLVMANAMALEGLKPFVSIYSTFLQRGYDEVQQDIARMNLPVVIGIDRAGIVGEDGETHQGIYDISYLQHIPNLVIMAPSNAIEAGDLLYTAFNLNSPVAIRYSRRKILDTKTKPKKLKLGSWDIIAEGKDGFIITYGDFVQNAKIIREKLLKDKIDISIINARFIKPYDKGMLNKIFKKNKPIFVYEEVATIGSLGERLCLLAEEQKFKNHIKCFSIDDKFIEQGKVEEVIKEIKLDPISIYEKIKLNYNKMEKE